MGRKYLQLTRLHSAPLEAVPASMGALVATQGELTHGVLFWSIFGILYHASGYGANSLRDWQKGFDKEDENKMHHPLNDGRMSEDEAETIVYGLLSLSLIYGIVGSYIYNIDALLPLFIMAAAGMVYNEFGKYTEHKYVFISIAHSLVFLSTFVAMGGSLVMPGIGIAVTVFVFIWVVFQIAISGEVKDIRQDGEENLLRKMGVKIEEGNGRSYMTDTKKARVVAVMLRVDLIVIGVAVSIGIFDSLVSAILVAVIGIFSIATADAMMASGVYERDEKMSRMALIEMQSLFMFCTMLYPIVGVEVALSLVILSIAWVVVFNRIQWGTSLAPSV